MIWYCGMNQIKSNRTFCCVFLYRFKLRGNNMVVASMMTCKIGLIWHHMKALYCKLPSLQLSWTGNNFLLTCLFTRTMLEFYSPWLTSFKGNTVKSVRESLTIGSTPPRDGKISIQFGTTHLPYNRIIYRQKKETNKQTNNKQNQNKTNKQTN